MSVPRVCIRPCSVWEGDPCVLHAFTSVRSPNACMRVCRVSCHEVGTGIPIGFAGYSDRSRIFRILTGIYNVFCSILTALRNTVEYGISAKYRSEYKRNTDGIHVFNMCISMYFEVFDPYLRRHPEGLFRPQQIRYFT